MGNLISKSTFKRRQKLEITPEEKQDEVDAAEPEQETTVARDLSSVKDEASEELKKIMDERRRERAEETESPKKLQKQSNVTGEPS